MDELVVRVTRVRDALRESTPYEISEDIINNNGFILLYRGDHDIFIVDKATRTLFSVGYDAAVMTSQLVSEHFLKRLTEGKIEVEGVEYISILSAHYPYKILYYDKEKDMHCVEYTIPEGD